MTPAEYVNEIVLPTVREFRDDRRSRRRAYVACIVTYHVKDYLQKAGETNARQRVKEVCPDTFELVRSICNGSKHVETDRNHEVQFRAGSDWDRPPAFAGVMRTGLTYLNDLIGGREVQAGGRRLDLYGCVKTLLLAFQQKFPAHLSGCDFSNF